MSWELQSLKGVYWKGQVYNNFLSEACSDPGLKIATAALGRGSPHSFLVHKQTSKALGGVVLTLPPTAADVESLLSLHEHCRQAQGIGTEVSTVQGQGQQESAALGIRKLYLKLQFCKLETFLGLFSCEVHTKHLSYQDPSGLCMGDAKHICT